MPSGSPREVGEPGDDREAGEDVERHDDARARLVRMVVRVGGRAAGLAEEREVHAARHVGGGHERADDADDHERLVGVVDAELVAAGEDLVLRPEAGERRDADERDRCRSTNVQNVFGMKRLHAAHVLLHVEAVDRVRDRARAEEQAGLEERVREEVEQRGRPGADAERHDHVAELADGRVREHLLDVVLDEREPGAAEHGDAADDGEQVDVAVADRQAVEEHASTGAPP